MLCGDLNQGHARPKETGLPEPVGGLLRMQPHVTGLKMGFQEREGSGNPTRCPPPQLPECRLQRPPGSPLPAPRAPSRRLCFQTCLFS